MTGNRRALVVGATGITGANTAERLVAGGWDVMGLSRRSAGLPMGVAHNAVDLLDAAAVHQAIAGESITHLFFCSWSRQTTEAENIKVNGAMLDNAVTAAVAGGALAHVALVTGLKHYLGPPHMTDVAHQQARPPYKEDQERLPYANFYYNQEDILLEAADRHGFGWSVHRAHTVIGYALGNLMNMGVTLSLYATICRETGRPFVFPGSPEQYFGITDITDARLLAAQMEWAATDPAGRNQALNTVNGDTFAWRDMWASLAAWFGIDPAPYPGFATPLVDQKAELEDAWPKIASTYDLRFHDASAIASWWHSDADLGRRVDTYASMDKSRSLGFGLSIPSVDSFIHVFERLRSDRVIP